MHQDWRLTNQIKYLFHKQLMYSTFAKISNNDHEHCEFCMKKLVKLIQMRMRDIAH